MLNWEFLTPRNIAVIALISVIGFAAWNFFAKKIGSL